MNLKALLSFVAKPMERRLTVKSFHQMCRGIIPALFLTALFPVGSAYASLVFQGPIAGSGGGVGSSNIILDVQATGSESGCVAWNGANVTGAAACAGTGNTGGDEKTQTTTRTVLETGVTSSWNLLLIMNAAEPGSGASLQLENLVLTIYNAAGTLLWTSGDLTGRPILFPTTDPGAGSLGFGFRLDDAQAAASAGFITATNRFGISATLTLAGGSPEVFSIIDLARPVPEPVTLVTFAGGLAALGLLRRYRRIHAKG